MSDKQVQIKLEQTSTNASLDSHRLESTVAEIRKQVLALIQDVAALFSVVVPLTAKEVKGAKAEAKAEAAK